MGEIIKVKNKTKQDYNIYIGNKILEKIMDLVNISKYSKIVILTDKNLIQTNWLIKLQKGLTKKTSVIQIKSGEKNKNIKTVLSIWKEMQKAKLDRKSLLINLGGGVICDLGGFCASTYMRGIDFLQIPTTLLSQVDASIGGKTGFNLNEIKNCIGTFTHPIAVFIDTETLSTLPKREFISGFGEVIKYGFIYDKKFFDYLNNLNIKKLSKEEIKKIIKVSCEIKAKIVEKDFKEKGIRKILNYGHTLGHALESLSLKTNAPLLHGEAIAIGMIGAAYISEKLNRITKETFLQIQRMIQNFNLPISLKTKEKDYILSMLFKDKKTINKKINWVLMNKIGFVDFDIEVDKDIVKQAIDYITG